MSSTSSNSPRPDNSSSTALPNVEATKGKLSKAGRSNSVKASSSGGTNGSSSSSHIQNLVTRLPVLFSPGMEPSVRIVSEQKWAAKGEYFIGDHTSRGMSTTLF